MTQIQAASAKIYQFPVGGRAGQRALTDMQRSAIAEDTMSRGSALGSGESWYHAEAIQKAERAAT